METNEVSYCETLEKIVKAKDEEEMREAIDNYRKEMERRAEEGTYRVT